MISPRLCSAIHTADTTIEDDLCVTLQNFKVFIARTNGINGDLLRALFGNACAISASHDSLGRHDKWRFAALELHQFGDMWREIQYSTWNLQSTPVIRWFGDTEFDRYKFDWGYLLLQSVNLSAVTVCLTNAARIYYFFPPGGFNIPHFEHTIKYPLRVQMRRAHYLQVHGATRVYRGKGLAFFGKRRSGKSTILMKLLEEGGAVIGNDLSFIDIRQKSSQMVAFPHQTRLAIGTIDANPWLRKIFNQLDLWSRNYLENPVFNEGKYEIYYSAMVRLFQRDPMLKEFPLNAIVFPKLDLLALNSNYSEIRSDLAVDRVVRNLIDDPALPDWIPLYNDLQPIEKENIYRFIESLPPVYELRFGDTYTKPLLTIDRLVEEI